MAISIGRGSDELVESHDINVTPFIDVMLVLLVIFMVTAPLATVDIPVKLPVASAQPKPLPDKPVYVTITPDGGIAVGEGKVAQAALPAALATASGGNREAQLLLRADRSINYGRLMEVLNALRAAGYLKVGLVGMPGGTDG